MHFFIKEWPDKSATFMTAADQALWTFSSLAEARHACRNYFAVRIHTDQHLVEDNVHVDCAPPTRSASR